MPARRALFLEVDETNLPAIGLYRGSVSAGRQAARLLRPAAARLQPARLSCAAIFASSLCGEKDASDA
jgi:ribosomal protein S18 acetylase RimI-like enzyme